MKSSFGKWVPLCAVLVNGACAGNTVLAAGKADEPGVRPITALITNAAGVQYRIEGLFQNSGKKRDSHTHFRDEAGAIFQFPYSPNVPNAQLSAGKIRLDAWIRSSDTFTHDNHRIERVEHWFPVKAYAIDLGFDYQNVSRSLAASAIGLPSGWEMESLKIADKFCDIRDMHSNGEAMSQGGINPETGFQVLGEPLGPPLGLMLILIIGPERSSPAEPPQDEFNLFLTVFTIAHETDPWNPVFEASQ